MKKSKPPAIELELKKIFPGKTIVNFVSSDQMNFLFRLNVSKFSSHQFLIGKTKLIPNNGGSYTKAKTVPEIINEITGQAFQLGEITGESKIQNEIKSILGLPPGSGKKAKSGQQHPDPCNQSTNISW